MTVTVTMLQTRRGEDGNPWTAGNSYAASDAFAQFLIASNLATGALPQVPQSGLSPSDTVALKGLVSGAGNTTWANRASVLAAGLTQGFFSDVGVGGSYWDYVGGRWRPQARSVVLYNSLTPMTLNSGTKTVVDYLAVLAGLVQDGDIIEYAFLCEKDGLATDVYTIDICAGAAAATVGTSLGLATGGLASGQKQVSPAPIRVRRESATSLRPVSVGGATGTGQNTGANTAVTVPSMDSAWYLQLAAQRTTGTTEVMTGRHFMATLISGA